MQLFKGNVKFDERKKKQIKSSEDVTSGIRYVARKKSILEKI